MGLLAIVVLGCDMSALLPGGQTFATAAPGAMETVIAGTAQAAQTQTAALLPASATPSLTPTVTRTPTSTPTATPTFLFLLRTRVPPRTPTPTGGGSSGSGSSGSGGYSCVLVSQKPTDGTAFKPNANFDMVWTMENSGGKTWQVNDVDFAYVSGRKMQAQDAYDLPRDVVPGETVAMTVKMNAPKLAGEWKTVWTLKAGGNDFCHVNVTIVVK